MSDAQVTGTLPSVVPEVSGAVDYTLVDSKEKLAWLTAQLTALPDNHVIGLDHETTGLYWVNDRVVGTGLSWADGQAVYLPHLHRDQGEFGFGTAENTEVMRLLKRFRIVTHRTIFDTSFTWATFGVALPIWDDTMLLARLLEKPGSLDGIMMQEFGHGKPVEFKELMAQLFGRNWKSAGKTAADALAKELFLYCCRDADFCRRAYFLYKPLVLASKQLSGLHKVEVNVLPLVRRMNCRGTPVDLPMAGILAELMRVQNDKRLEGMYELAKNPLRPDGVFNPQSHPQVGKLLFEELGLPILQRSKETQAPSASAEVLEQLEGNYPIAAELKKWREDSYAYKTYFSGLPTSADKEGRVHTEFDSVGAVSGRFTSGGNESRVLTQEPNPKKTEYRNWGLNLQNVSNAGVNFLGEALVTPHWPENPPQPDVNGVYDFLELYHAGLVVTPPPLGEDGKEDTAWVAPPDSVTVQARYDVKARELFIAPPGWTWVKADLSQIEYRLLASISQEEFLLDGFRAGHDYHKITASLFLGVPLGEVSKEQRAKGKTVNFAVGYGGGPDKVAKLLGISVDEARQRMEQYWARLPKVQALEAFSHQRALKEKMAKTVFGRVRSFDFPPQMTKGARDHILRQAHNHLIQGTAAEILKLGMLRVERYLRPYAKHVEWLLQVHDELDFLVRDGVVQDVIPLVKRAMETPVPDNWVKVVAEVSYGPAWAERCQTKWETPEWYAPDPWEGWGRVLPDGVIPHAEV